MLNNANQGDKHINADLMHFLLGLLLDM